MKRANLLIILVIFLFSFSLRYIGLVNRAPFDWDQNRDYSQVLEITRGKYVPLGPVAKGEGGFYLGSLYYYLLIPIFLAFSGDLSALPLTSIIIDSLVPAFLFLLFRKSWGLKKSLSAVILWSISWFILEASRVSWNISLISFWSLLTLFSMSKILTNKSSKYLYGLSLLFGLSFHIHVSAIPIIPLLALIFIRKFHFSLKDWTISLIITLFPLIPLIQYDLTHSFENLHLVRNLIGYQNSFMPPFIPMLNMIIIKLGKVVQGIFVAEFRNSYPLGLLTMFLALFSLAGKRILPRLSGLLILISSLMILLLHDIGFPEYYFALSYLPIIIVYIDFASRILSKSRNTAWLIGGIILVTLTYLNIEHYTTKLAAYSLGAQEQIVSSLTSYEGPLDVRLRFIGGRGGGLEYLLDRHNIARNPSARNQILLTDTVDGPIYIDGELCEDKLVIGNIKVGYHIVQ